MTAVRFVEGDRLVATFDGDAPGDLLVDGDRLVVTLMGLDTPESYTTSVLFIGPYGAKPNASRQGETMFSCASAALTHLLFATDVFQHLTALWHRKNCYCTLRKKEQVSQV